MALTNEFERAVATPELVCATRASALALWQTRSVMALLADGAIASTMLTITTKGDAVQDRSIAAIGAENVFVKELENALLEGRADYAVHSCKDLPSTMPDDLAFAAIARREDARDVLCSERYPSFEALPPGARVGTSSPRRRALLRAARPDLSYEDIRGNVDTRLGKLHGGNYDAIVLAAAGLKRLGLGATYSIPFALDVLVPAVAQGALAIQMRANDPRLSRIHALLNDAPTERAVRAERAFLRTLRGGCQTPVGAHAAYEGDVLTLHAAIAAADGSAVVRGHRRLATTSVADTEAASVAFANELLAGGGAELLAPRIEP